ncbi:MULTISPECIES: hypothetical protein [Cytobacillus]|uniref:hypothetical protein n=1 Tax=Cytobacillus TaxID=2675230 RepID=UPI00203ABA1F|nr:MULTISPECIES: hypothetical protein [Cytobacillus]MCM3394833.1 hypothetical protein [Cytobacillus oceanisediminis]UQX56090.1 hypothetical protein M5V91_10920 [Cytobacillus pseudoceanisediminis]
MNQVVVQETSHIMPFNPYLKDIEALIDECVSINKDMLIFSIKQSQGYSAEYILETFVYKILAGLYQDKTSEQLLELISGGGIFEVKELMMKKLQSNPDILSCIPKRA